jgi:hypothetical protein
MAVKKCKLYEPSQTPAFPKGCCNRKANGQGERFEGEFLHFQPSGSVFVISRGHSQGFCYLFA